MSLLTITIILKHSFNISVMLNTSAKINVTTIQVIKNASLAIKQDFSL